MPPVAIVALVVVSGSVVLAAIAAGTFGYDFAAYHQAAVRLLHGQPIYDPTVQAAGGFGFFYYPPPFAIAIAPLGLIPLDAATWIWFGASVVLLVAGIALLPVRPTVRWATLLLAGLSWPVAYALKLGQVGPLLLFLFAISWRRLDDALAVGASAALGAIVKIQPGIVVLWALLTRRFGAVAAAAAVLIIGGIAATIAFGGLGIWGNYLTLLRNVSDPITTPHNFTPGAAAYQAGISRPVAEVIQIASSGAAAIAVVVAAIRLRPDASLQVTIVASQLLSPVLWDHYAMLLLLPVAWLLERHRWWAVATPLATSAAVLFVNLPAAIYPMVFWITLLAVLDTARREPQPASA